MKYILLALLASMALSADAEAWKSKTIYQIVTDRFYRTDGSTAPCTDLKSYCGGTFKGIQSQLDYIQGMGFDAIWVSPIVKNTALGYHGYWAANLYELNEHFGTKDDFKNLVKALHAREM